MDAQELQKMLDEIHTAVDEGGSIDEKGLDLLRDLNQHIAELIARSEGRSIHPHPSTIQQLEQGVTHFEVTHPTLTLLLSNFLNTLSSSGI